VVKQQISLTAILILLYPGRHCKEIVAIGLSG